MERCNLSGVKYVILDEMDAHLVDGRLYNAFREGEQLPPSETVLGN